VPVVLLLPEVVLVTSADSPDVRTLVVIDLPSLAYKSYPPICYQTWPVTVLKEAPWVVLPELVATATTAGKQDLCLLSICESRKTLTFPEGQRQRQVSSLLQLPAARPQGQRLHVSLVERLVIFMLNSLLIDILRFVATPVLSDPL
jgi:hypothetical protein